MSHVDAIEANNKAFATAVSSADAAGITAVYTEDSQVMATGADTITGLDNIHAFWQSMLDAGLRSAELTTVELDVRDDMAVESGLYDLADGEGNRIDRGKYIVIWANNGGEWRWRLDIFNSSVPAD